MILSGCGLGTNSFFFIFYFTLDLCSYLTVPSLSCTMYNL